MNEPLVSICMPMYNVEEYIYETLSKFLEQTYENIELIIVNDNSMDRSLEIVESFKSEKIKIFTNPSKGACSARNYAFSKSSGEYIKFMDADDFCTPNLIEKQVSMLHTLDKDDVVFSPLKMLYPDGSLILPQRSIDKDYENAFDLQVEILKFGGFNIPHCYMMHRDLVEKVGGWDEAILKNQDGEYFSRVLANANKAKNISSEYAIWRQTGTGISSKKSIETLSSMINTYLIIFKITLEKRKTKEIKNICGEYIGLLICRNYLTILPILDNLERKLLELNIEIILPNRKVIKFLNIFFNWKSTLYIINKLKI